MGFITKQDVNLKLFSSIEFPISFYLFEAQHFLPLEFEESYKYLTSIIIINICIISFCCYLKIINL